MESKALASTVPRELPRRRRRLPTELSIFLVLVGIALVYEVLGWFFVVY